MMKRVIIGLMIVALAGVTGLASAGFTSVQLTGRNDLDAFISFSEAGTEYFRFELDDSDANAACLVLDMPAGSATHVPVLLLASSTSDYGYFNGTTFPTLAIEDDDGDSWISIGFTADDTAEIQVGGAASTITIPDVAGTSYTDDIDFSLGTGSPMSFEYTTADADAACLIFDLAAGDANDVPVVMLTTTDANFGYFNGETYPTLAVEDDDGDSYFAFSWAADDTPEFSAGGSATYIRYIDAVHFGVDDTGVDVDFFGAGTGNYIVWDESIDTLVAVDGNVKMDDDAILYFGTGTNVTTADGDFTVNFTDGSPGVLSLTASSANDRITIAGGADILIDNATSAGADISWDDSGEVWQFGVTNLGVDVKFWGDTASVLTWWDESGDTWYFGANDYGPDVYVYGATDGDYLTFDASIDTLSMVDYNQKFDDDAVLYFGTGTNVTTADGDFTVNFTDGSPGYLTVTAVTAEDVFQIGNGTIATDVLIQNTTTAGADITWDDSGELWSFGVTNTGVDVQFWGDTDGDYILFDESGDELIVEDIKINIMDDTTLVFGDGEDIVIEYDEDGDNDLRIDGDVSFDHTVDFGGGQTRMVRWDPKDVELDGTNPATLTDLGTDGQCNISSLTFDADGGVNGDDVCYITWKVPDGYVVDSARLNVAYTISDALDAADEAQFDFAVNAVAAGEALDAAGTALADQTTVIADASSGAGKLYVTQYNIEVEEIAVDDLVTIEIAVDESESDVDAGTFNVLYFEIEYESTE